MHALFTLLGCASLLAPPTQEAALDPREHARVELVAARASCFVGEHVVVVLRVELEARFLAENVVPSLRRALDLPVQVEASWLTQPTGFWLSARQPEGVGDGARPSLALGERVVRATRAGELEREGRRWRVFEVERAIVPRAAGELALEGPSLRLAYATRFEDDFLAGRAPLDRREAVLRGDALALAVQPLPEAGRPADFGGAVGRFRLRATAEPRELAAGESIALVLEIEGAGELEGFDPPRLDALEGFHVFARIDEPGPALRRVRYDLAPLDAALRAFPAIRLPYFDPEPPGAWRVALSEPIPLLVHAPRGGELPEPLRRPRAQRSDEREPEQLDRPQPLGASRVLLPFFAAGIVALVLVRLRKKRRRARAAVDPALERARRAAAELRASLDRPGAERSALFADYLAARLATTSAAVVGPDLVQRLAAAGIPPELARRAASAQESLVAARYGASGGASPAELLDLVGALELCFATAE